MLFLHSAILFLNSRMKKQVRHNDLPIMCDKKTWGGGETLKSSPTCYYLSSICNQTSFSDGQFKTASGVNLPLGDFKIAVLL